MFAITFAQVGQVAVQILPDAALLEPTDVVVQVEMAGLCGSDLHPFWGREPGLDPGTVMGHEFVGRVIEIGSQVQKFRTGDLVFAPFSTNCGQCFYCSNGLPSRCPQGQLFGWRQADAGLHGSQAQFVRVPLADGTLLKVPATMSHELALLLGDNLSTGYYCAELAGASADGLFAVIGCGNVGLMALVAAQHLGCRQLIAIDPVPERRGLAEQLGARALPPGPEALAEVRRRSAGRGADGVLELVGLPAAQRLAYDLVRPGGTIATVGCHCDQTFAFSPVQAYDKNLTYRTGRCPARHYMERLWQRPEILALDIAPFITHRFQLEEGPRAYELFSQRQDGIVKGLFDLR